MSRSLAAGLILLMLATTANAQVPQRRVCVALGWKIAEHRAGREDISPRLLHDLIKQAVQTDCPGLTDELLQAGAGVTVQDGSGRQLLGVAARAGSRRVIPVLLAAGARLEHRDLAGNTPLIDSAKADAARVVTLLVEAGADPDAADSHGVTALMAAAFNGNLRVLRALLDKGAAVDARDKDGKTALAYAAARGFGRIVEALVEAGAEPTQPLGHDLTPLMWVAGHPNDTPAPEALEVARMLLDRGVSLDARDDRGRDALMIAAARGNAAMLRFLLDQGADPDRRDLQGKSALDLAANDETRRALQGAGNR